MIILGIETSCDETAAAVVVDGNKTLSSVVSSQTDIHHPYGGVVPELASRKHIESIVPVVKEAIGKSGIDLKQLDGIAVTQGPGLIGSLLVGFSFAKAYAFALDIPWVGVNHLDGHINSVFLESDPPPFPFVALLASGGHTSITHVVSYTEIELMGQTRDDAAGEAFDKVAKLLGLGYPGGIVIERLAKDGDPGKIDFPRTYLDKSGFDFSFSGIKTAVSRYVKIHEGTYKQQIPDITAGFQESVIDVLSYKVINAALEKSCDHIAVVGGVAANSRLRERLKTGQVPWELSSLEGDFFFMPGNGKTATDITPSGRIVTDKAESVASKTSDTDALDDEAMKIEDEDRKLEKEKALLGKKKALEEKRQKIEEEKAALEAKKNTTLSMGKRPTVSTANEIKRDGRFIAYGDGTVLDTSTNLMWAAKDNGSDINWQNAKNYCENYRGGGYTDWRMPTLSELAGLYDAGKTYQSECRRLFSPWDLHLTELNNHKNHKLHGNPQSRQRAVTSSPPAAS